MASALARRKRAHRRFLEQVAGEAFWIAIAGPSLEAEKRRAGPHPQRGQTEAGEIHFDRRAVGLFEPQRAARRLEKAQGVASEEFVIQRQHFAFERDRALVRTDQAARRDRRNMGGLVLREPDDRADALSPGERPAEAGMEAAGVRGRSVAGIGDFERDLQRRAGEAIFDREFERERVKRARPRVVAKRQPGESAARRLDGEVLAGGETVQPQRIAAPPTRAPSRVQPTTG